MRKALNIYPTIFTFDGKHYNVSFIDLPISPIHGDSIENAYYIAQESIGQYLDGLKNFPNIKLDISNVKLEENQFLVFVSIDMTAYLKSHSKKSIKKTLTIPKWLDTLAKQNNINFSEVLREALKEKLGID